MEEDNFYILLNSNVILKPECDYNCEFDENVRNRIGNFINRFNKRIILKGDWELALTNIHYRKSWFNIPEDQTLELVDHIGTYHYTISDPLPAGNYINPIDMIDKINEIYANFSEYS